MALVPPQLNTSSGPSTILVVEDEFLIRMVATDILTSAGFMVIEASHADQAVSILRSRACDVHALFTDVHMPGSMDGLMLTHHTRRNWPWISLLVTSGRAIPHVAEMPHGSRFLQKPYEPAKLLEHLHEMVPVPAPAYHPRP